jgi:hypothetical protein
MGVAVALDESHHFDGGAAPVLVADISLDHLWWPICDEVLQRRLAELTL